MTLPFTIELLTRIDYYVYMINKDSITYSMSEKNCDDMVRITSNTNNRLDYIIKSTRMSSSENLHRFIGIILTKKYNYSSCIDVLYFQSLY